MDNLSAAFIGSIPRYYDQYLVPFVFQDYAIDLVRRISVPPGGTMLETAAGTGVVTRLARNALPKDVRIVATDFNAAMLDFAKSKFDANDNIEFQTADATHLLYPNAAFDTVVCQFGVMFFPDKLAGIQEAARVLKPGGTFIFNVWDSLEQNPLGKTVNDTIARLFANPPPFYHTPYGYYQTDLVRGLLSESGFGDIEISILPRTTPAQTPRQVAMGYILGTPMGLQIAQRKEYTVEQVVEIVERALADTFGQSAIRAKMQAIVVKAYLAAPP